MLVRSIPRRFAALPLLLIAPLVLALAACAGGGSPAPTPSPSQTAAAPTSTPAPTAAPFPVTLTDDEGTQVTLATQPRRVASLTPAVTETIFALGAADALVARVEDPALYPPASEPIPTVAAFGTVDVEKIVGLDVDLVIAGGLGFTPLDAVTRLRALGIPVLVVYAPDVDGVLADIELVGAAVGRATAAAELTATMRAEIDAIGAAVRQGDPPRVFYEIDALKEIYGPADDSFLEELIRIAGGDPITTGNVAVFEISLERLVQADPEVLLLGDAAYGVTAELVASRPGWGGMTAVETGAMRPIDDIVVTRPGPRLVAGLRALAQAIDPSAALPSAAP